MERIKQIYALYDVWLRRIQISVELKSSNSALTLSIVPFTGWKIIADITCEMLRSRIMLSWRQQYLKLWTCKKYFKRIKSKKKNFISRPEWIRHPKFLLNLNFFVFMQISTIWANKIVHYTVLFFNLMVFIWWNCSSCVPRGIMMWD